MTVFYDDQRARWRYDFRVTGKRHTGYCVNPGTGAPAETKTDAKRIEAALKVAAHQEAPLPKPSADYTVAQMFIAYATRKQGLKDWPNKRVYIAEILGWFGPETAVAEITDQRIWDYIAWARLQPVMVYRGGPKVTTPEERAKPTRHQRTGAPAPTRPPTGIW